MLEQAGLHVFLVNPRHFEIVPGRKSDYNDAQWLQKLHALGLLQGSFRPHDEMCVLRLLLRHRAQLIEHRSPHILHMQKSLNPQRRVLCSDDGMVELTGRVQKTGSDVVRLEVWIIGEDFLVRFANSEEFEYVDDADAHPADAGASAILLKVNRDSRQEVGLAHWISQG